MACLAQGERLGQCGQHPHGAGRCVGTQQHPVGQPHQPTAPHRGSHLPRAKARGVEVGLLRGGERCLRQPFLELAQSLVRRAQLGTHPREPDAPLLEVQSRSADHNGHQGRVGHPRDEACRLSSQARLERVEGCLVSDGGADGLGPTLDCCLGDQPVPVPEHTVGARGGLLGEGDPQGTGVVDPQRAAAADLNGKVGHSGG